MACHSGRFSALSTDNKLAPDEPKIHIVPTPGDYDENLSAERLRRCYEVASSRVWQYLEDEIEHVLTYVEPSCAVLELGCGYGRVLERLA